MLLTVALVVLVILLFLRHGRATLIPALSLPISLLGTFGLMHLLDLSLNSISLMGLTIAVGLVVDDAIVVLENIMRHIEEACRWRRRCVVPAKSASRSSRSRCRWSPRSFHLLPARHRGRNYSMSSPSWSRCRFWCPRQWR